MDRLGAPAQRRHRVQRIKAEIAVDRKKPPACGIGGAGGFRESVSPSAVWEHGRPLKPRYGRMADAVRPADIGQGYTGFASAQGLADLECREFRFATKSNTTSLSPSASFAVLLKIMDRSNSANTPRTARISLP